MTAIYDIAEHPVDTFAYDVKILYQLSGLKFDTFSELCAQTLDSETLQDYHKAVRILHAHFQSYLECGISTAGYPVSELVPENTLSRFNDAKSCLVERLLNRFHDDRVMAFYEQFFERVACLQRISGNLGLKFNYVGSVTGRLGFKRGTFNPYVLPKERRDCIKARDGFSLCQFDLKASQPRMAIFSTLDHAFRERCKAVDDIYSLFPGDRERNKVGLLRWMFSANPYDTTYGKVAGPIKALQAAICQDAYRDGHVSNRFHRPLRFTSEAPHVIFQHYISSTEADALYEIVQAVDHALKGTKSRVLLPFYDAILCEFSDDEPHLRGQIQSLMQNHFSDHVFFAQFPVDVKTGPDFAHMETLH